MTEINCKIENVDGQIANILAFPLFQAPEICYCQMHNVRMALESNSATIW